MAKKIFIHVLWIVPVFLIAVFILRMNMPKAEISPGAYPPPGMESDFQSIYPPPLDFDEAQSVYPSPGEEGDNGPLPPQAKSVSTAAMRAIEYVAIRYSVPKDVLDIAYDHPTEYPSLGRKFQVVTLLDTRGKGQVYKLLVDLLDGSVTEDISAMIDAEAQAYQSKYGKFLPELYNLLQTKNDDDNLTVAVWVAPPPGKTSVDLEAAIFEMLAAKYPEAQEAINRGGMPMDVDDPELARQIEDEYVALMNAEINERTHPLVDELESRGFAITTYEGIPSFSATLPKVVILELSRREDVSRIYLVDAEQTTELENVEK